MSANDPKALVAGEGFEPNTWIMMQLGQVPKALMTNISRPTCCVHVASNSQAAPQGLPQQPRPRVSVHHPSGLACGRIC